MVSPGDHTTGVLSAATMGLEQRQVSARHDDNDDGDDDDDDDDDDHLYSANMAMLQQHAHSPIKRKRKTLKL